MLRYLNASPLCAATRELHGAAAGNFSFAAIGIVAFLAAPVVQAACTDPVGDVTSSGKLNVADTLCITLVALFTATGSQGDTPDCLGGGSVLNADFNCDGGVYVSDAQLHLLAVLGNPMDAGIDSDANFCPDACQGPCVGKPDGAPCNADSNGCTVDDACQGGVCTAGTLTTCGDGLACTTDICNSTGNDSFSCSNALNADSCLICGTCYQNNQISPNNACQACVPATSTTQFTYLNQQGCGDACLFALGVTCDDFDEAYVKASNTSTNDRFGRAVALWGDVLAVGAWFEDSAATGINGVQSDNSAPDSGAVYVFRRTGGVWAQEAYIKASNTNGGDQFGGAVALWGDTLAVGAWNEDSAATGINGAQADNSAANSGAVYVFRRTAGVWAQEAYIKASNTGGGDGFGDALALWGDTLAVGARLEDSDSTGINGDQTNNLAAQSGAVYVFQRTGVVWAQGAYLKASNTGAGDQFGGAVALDGESLAVGARQEDSTATGINGDQTSNAAESSGAVYVFRRTGGVWAQEAYIKASNTDAGDLFGAALALSGDTLAVGATGEDSAFAGVNVDQTDNAAAQSGAVYVFRRASGGWAQEAYLKASNPGAGDTFGSALALSGHTLAVGATGEDSGSTGVNGDQTDSGEVDGGAVYVFRHTAAAWYQAAYVKSSVPGGTTNPNLQSGDLFGNALSLSGGTLVVGAVREGSSATGINGNQVNNSALESGAVFVRKIAPCDAIDYPAACACGDSTGPVCGPGSGSCTSAHCGAGCDNLACCAAVCDVEPHCCLTLWDDGCAYVAAAGACKDTGCSNGFFGLECECEAQPFDVDFGNLGTMGTFATPALAVPGAGVTVTGSANVYVGNDALGIVGGYSSGFVDGNEWIEFSFSPPVTHLAYFVGGAFNLNGKFGAAEAEYSAFDAQGGLIGAVAVSDGSWIHVSNALGLTTPIGRLRVQALGDAIRIAGISFYRAVCPEQDPCLGQPDGAACNADSNGCTINDVCVAGECIAGALFACSDNLACTTDSCIPFGNNSYTCLNSLDASRCLIDGVCYQANQNNPTNACQACVPAASTSQFTNKLDGTFCNADSDGCTEDDVCQAGVCTAGPRVTCSDGLGCTTDTCTSTGNNTFACINTLLANRCLVGGVCYVGNNNNPANPCQFCVPTTSTSQFTNKVDGATCNADSNGCTKDDACQAGVCVAGTLMTCADGLGCTMDACNSTGNNSFSCSNTLNANRCLIGGKCYMPGAENPENNCQRCTPSSNPTGWTSELPTVWYADYDGDSFGTDADTALLCAALGTYSALVGGDCNDNNASVHPAADELCDNTFDDNCDGQVNEEGCLDACWLALGVTCGEFNEAYIKASNTGANDTFGHSVAVSGDTLAVGALYESSNATGINGNQANNSANVSGAVYVFRRTDGVWVQEAYVKASNTGAGDYFGISVALSGNALAVGASWEDSAATGINGDQTNNSATDSGAVYVFRRTNGVWAQEAYVKASNTAAASEFGRAVTLSGDTLAVGAPYESSNATGINGNQFNGSAIYSGAVYVFRRTNGVWLQEAYVKASNTNETDEFGMAVALSGNALAVGAPGEESNATGIDGNQTNNLGLESGAVYVFRRTNGVWLHEAYVKASNTGLLDRFGSAVAVSSDTLAVGAPGEDSNAAGINGNQLSDSALSSGAVYVFRRTSGVWAQEAYVKASNTGGNDEFGGAVALSGDTLAVGVRYEDSNAIGINGDQSNNAAVNSGAGYLFRRTNAVWAQQAYVKAPNTDAGDGFGHAVALSGTTLAVGARLEASNATGVNGNQANNSAQQSGAVYVRKIAP